MEQGRKPDALEYGVRFGCGLLFGLAFAAAGALWWIDDITVTTCAIGAGVAVVIGLLAMRYGDRFWSRASWLSDLL